jgi:hypothetical protein
MRPRSKTIVALCHRQGWFLRKAFVRYGNGRRKVEYIIEPEGLVVRERFALEAITQLTPRDFDLFGRPATWTASKTARAATERETAA